MTEQPDKRPESTAISPPTSRPTPPVRRCHPSSLTVRLRRHGRRVDDRVDVRHVGGPTVGRQHRRSGMGHLLGVGNGPGWGSGPSYPPPSSDPLPPSPVPARPVPCTELRSPSTAPHRRRRVRRRRATRRHRGTRDVRRSLRDPSAPFGRDPVTGEPYSDKSRATAGLLQILLGFISLPGIGRLYIGSIGIGLTQLLVFWLGLITIIFGIGFVIFPVIWIWAFVDGILMLSGAVATLRAGR